MVQKYFTVSDKHDGAYHESLLGSKVVIMEREGLQAQLVMYLDQIAALLEMMAVVNPDILIASGFDLTKDRRGRARTNATAAARSAAGTEQADGESGA
ncbi:hypothetical protein M1B72_08830 [Geomonas paludis]|uniref:Histone deacetylase domain-containing protein n=1 Tax=Geomonas paludis TaxID=2740185 RepID=A0ABY4LII7_9BACT|nr:hypothetical protein [Geomonas paludis]UPU37794.1 hypothetical protein M1B72_08830 [Geomonas paludis]